MLLIGQDDGRSDSMILASINKKTDQITLASFFRDSYSYINYNGEDRYTKMNAAYAWGGPELLIETLENNFKVEIDYYVTVNFENFSKAIDAIGGVYVDVQPYESEYIRRTSRFKNFPVGNMCFSMEMRRWFSAGSERATPIAISAAHAGSAK